MMSNGLPQMGVKGAKACLCDEKALKGDRMTLRSEDDGEALKCDCLVESPVEFDDAVLRMSSSSPVVLSVIK